VFQAKGQGVTNTYEKIQKVFGNGFVSNVEEFWWHNEIVKGRGMAED
jgi:hypothetical protein